MRVKGQGNLCSCGGSQASGFGLLGMHTVQCELKVFHICATLAWQASFLESFESASKLCSIIILHDLEPTQVHRAGAR